MEQSKNAPKGSNETGSSSRMSLGKVEDCGDDLLEKLLDLAEDEEARKGTSCILDSVTINDEYDELCGPSFAAAGKTVMAGLDTRSTERRAMPYFYGSDAPPIVIAKEEKVGKGLIGDSSKE
ncbi:hypothetical protein KSP39_PZI024341 [Platanthera zijinensis]|uniref:Uncharacterized protein n=1 Tax=Platanthera zijinensis TaxID=2320716 RepID=A0AAP0FTE9_9ASPA